MENAANRGIRFNLAAADWKPSLAAKPLLARRTTKLERVQKGGRRTFDAGSAEKLCYQIPGWRGVHLGKPRIYESTSAQLREFRVYIFARVLMYIFDQTLQNGEGWEAAALPCSPRRLTLSACIYDDSMRNVLNASAKVKDSCGSKDTRARRGQKFAQLIRYSSLAGWKRKTWSTQHTECGSVADRTPQRINQFDWKYVSRRWRRLLR